MTKTLQEYQMEEEKRKNNNKKYYENKTKTKRQEVSKVKKEEKNIKKELVTSSKNLMKELNDKQLQSVNTFMYLLLNSPKPDINNENQEQFQKTLALRTNMINLLNSIDDYNKDQVKPVETVEIVKPIDTNTNINTDDYKVVDGIVINKNIEKQRQEEDEEINKFCQNLTNQTTNNKVSIDNNLIEFINNKVDTNQKVNKKSYLDLIDDVGFAMDLLNKLEIKKSKDLIMLIREFKINNSKYETETEDNKQFINDLLNKLNTSIEENTKTKEELFNDYIQLLHDNINNDKLPSIYKLNIEDKNIDNYTSEDLINVMYTIKNEI